VAAVIRFADGRLVKEDLEELAKVALQASILNVLERLQGEIEFALAHDETFEDLFKVFTSVLIVVGGQRVHAVESRHFLGYLLDLLFELVQILQVVDFASVGILALRSGAQHEALHHLVSSVDYLSQLSKSFFFHVLSEAITSLAELA